MKRTIVLDFDGVIHSYTSGYQGRFTIPDPPVEGIADAIRELRKDFRVVVVSTRCQYTGGVSAVIGWLHKWGIQVDDVRATKPPAVVYVDDRALCFDGDAAALPDKIRNFKTWQGK